MPASPLAAWLAGRTLVRPPVQPTPQQQTGPQTGSSLAMPVANPGSRGQNMRYFLGNLQRLPNGDYTDGVYVYDEGGLSRDRPDAPVSGLPPADESERWNVWRAPSLNLPPPPGAPGLPGTPFGGPGIGGLAPGPSMPAGGFTAPAMGQISSPSSLIASLAGLIPRPGPNPAAMGLLPPEEAAQMPPGEGFGAENYSGAASLAELLRVALQRGKGGRRFLA